MATAAAARVVAAALAAAEPGAAVAASVAWAGADALVVRAGVASVPAAARGSETVVPLAGVTRAVVVGAGKAAVAMTAALVHVLAARPPPSAPLAVEGVVVTKYGHVTAAAAAAAALPATIAVMEAGHPVPDAAGAVGAAALLAAVRRAAAAPAACVVFLLLSGGASALTPAPPPPVTLAELSAVSTALLACGAAIDDVNAVRKHVSEVAGGGLAAAAGAARVVTLALSDVIGDRLDVIGSGPTVPDASTWRTAAAVVDAYALRDALPRAVVARIDAGVAGALPDTLKAARAGDVATVVGSAARAVDAAASAAAAAGYTPYILTTALSGEARACGGVLAAMAVDAARGGTAFKPPACLLAGGEPTVTLPPAAGVGGRNQELVLAACLAARRLTADAAERAAVTFVSCGTDGTDGPTDAAGAALSPAAASLEGDAAAAALARHDSYTFFAAAREPAAAAAPVVITRGGHVMTGPTGTNVGDVVAVFIDRRASS